MSAAGPVNLTRHKAFGLMHAGCMFESCRAYCAAIAAAAAARAASAPGGAPCAYTMPQRATDR